MNPKKPLPLDENLEQRFFGIDKSSISLSSDPQNEIYPKNRCKCGVQSQTAIFWCLEICDKFKALSSECEAKSCC
jgi:hypothetical protein